MVTNDTGNRFAFTGPCVIHTFVRQPIGRTLHRKVTSPLYVIVTYGRRHRCARPETLRAKSVKGLDGRRPKLPRKRRPLSNISRSVDSYARTTFSGLRDRPTKHDFRVFTIQKKKNAGLETIVRTLVTVYIYIYITCTAWVYRIRDSKTLSIVSVSHTHTVSPTIQSVPSHRPDHTYV